MCEKSNLLAVSMYFSQGPIYVVTLTQTTPYTLQLSHFCDMYSNEKTNFYAVL